MSMSFVWCWIIVLVAAIIVEACTMGLTSIWFAGGALIATVMAAIGLPIWVQIFVFFAVSVLLLVFTRPIAMRYFNKDRDKTNVEAIIGQQGVVIETIDNINSTGSVKIGGMEWTARSVSNEIIEKDAVVTVKSVEGVKVLVTR